MELQVVKDFLYQCFQKDPNLRISAKMLAKHPWMTAAQRQANSTEEATSSNHQDASLTMPQGATNKLKSKILIPKRNRMSRAVMRSSDTFANGSTSFSLPGKNNIANENSVENLATLSNRPLTTVYDQAIQRVQEWNAALNGMCSRCV